MNQIADLHTHLDTLRLIYRLRGRFFNHMVHIHDYKKVDHKIILNVALYIDFFSNYEGLKELIIQLKNEIDSSKTDIVLLTEKEDLEKDFKIGIIFHIESARVLTDYKQQLPELYKLGVRGIIPMHFVDNHLGNSCDDPLRRIGLKKNDQGITEQGKEFIKLANELGLWIDLTHTTDRTGEDMLNLAEKVMVSHTGIRELRNYKRNKPLSFMKKVAAKGGIIGLTPWKHLVGNDFKENYLFAKKNGLSDNICIGSDFGAPIATQKETSDIFKIASLIEDQDFLYNNMFEYLKRNL